MAIEFMNYELLNNDTGEVLAEAKNLSDLQRPMLIWKERLGNCVIIRKIEKLNGLTLATEITEISSVSSNASLSYELYDKCTGEILNKVESLNDARNCFSELTVKKSRKEVGIIRTDNTGKQTQLTKEDLESYLTLFDEQQVGRLLFTDILDHINYINDVAVKKYYQLINDKLEQYTSYNFKASFTKLNKIHSIETMNYLIDFCLGLCGNKSYHIDLDWLEVQTIDIVNYVHQFIKAIKQYDKI